jgi:transposase
MLTIPPTIDVLVWCVPRGSQSIRHWVMLADRQEGRQEEKSEVLVATEREELTRLRRENKQLRLERDILSRAAAWFARETGAVPSGSSHS